MTYRLFMIAFGWLFLLSALAEGVESSTSREWLVDGVTREAIVYLPTAGKENNAPVVFVFHGHGGTARHATRSMAFHTVWPEAIVVYMQGLKTPGRLTDPEGKKNGWQHSVGDQSDRDLRFFDAVLASLKEDYTVDESRIYSTGHSNGGGFTYLLWSQRGDVFAAVAPSSGMVARGLGRLTPKPALHVAGEKDPLVKYEWQKMAMETVKKLNRCNSEGQEWASSGKLVGTQFASAGGTPFVTLIHPGGHEYLPEAPKLIVKFFKEHSLERK